MFVVWLTLPIPLCHRKIEFSHRMHLARTHTTDQRSPRNNFLARFVWSSLFLCMYIVYMCVCVALYYFALDFCMNKTIPRSTWTLNNICIGRTCIQYLNFAEWPPMFRHRCWSNDAYAMYTNIKQCSIERGHCISSLWYKYKFCDAFLIYFTIRSYIT